MLEQWIVRFRRLCWASAMMSVLSFHGYADDVPRVPSDSWGEWTSYGMLRLDLSNPRLEKRIPAPAVPEQTALLDFNLTGKKQLDENHRFQADIDAFIRHSGNFRKRNFLSGGVEHSSDDSSENPSYRLSLNESYFNGEVPGGFQYTVGKKRILWGTGFAANPTDLLNPAKNPLDPTLERRGAWLLQAEHVQEKQTFALVVAPEVLENKNTLPTDIVVFSDSAGKRRAHFLLAGRWYLLVGEADLNFMAFLSERFREERASHLKIGASWSQIATPVSKKLETHAEILLHQGTTALSPRGDSRAMDEKLYYRSLLGFRYDFENEASLSVEYLYQSDGDSAADFQTRLERQGDALNRLSRLSLSLQGLTISAPTLRQTLFFNVQRYKFTDDLFLSWAVAHNLQDQSGYQGPILQWTPTQTIALNLSASTDYNLQKESGARLVGRGNIRANELNPVKSRLGLEFKSYF